MPIVCWFQVNSALVPACLCGVFLCGGWVLGLCWFVAGIEFFVFFVESLILAQDERWRRA